MRTPGTPERPENSSDIQFEADKAQFGKEVSGFIEPNVSILDAPEKNEDEIVGDDNAA
jgi:hypothetical protein